MKQAGAFWGLVVAGVLVAGAIVLGAVVMHIPGPAPNRKLTEAELPVTPPAPVEVNPVRFLGPKLSSIERTYTAEHYSFEDGKTGWGFPRRIGQSADKVSVVDLVGANDEIVYARLVIGTSPDHVVENTKRIIEFMPRVAPSWEGGTKWVLQNLGGDIPRVTHVEGVVLYVLDARVAENLIIISAKSRDLPDTDD